MKRVNRLTGLVGRVALRAPFGCLCARLSVLVTLLALHPSVQACAVCFGKSDSAMAKGMNMGIFALLTCITGVLATLSTFFIFLAVRSSKHPQREAMEAALNSSKNPAHS
jgi:hypothetical protein